MFAVFLHIWASLHPIRLFSVFCATLFVYLCRLCCCHFLC